MSLTTALPEKPIGSKIVFPKGIKGKLCIIGLENVDHNLCFWYCSAYVFYAGRIDRLKYNVYDLFLQYYGEQPKFSCEGASMTDQLQPCQFFGQNLAILELCFENHKDINDYTTKHFN